MVAAMIILLNGYQLPQPPSSLGDLVALVERRTTQIINPFFNECRYEFLQLLQQYVANHCMSPVQQVRWMLSKNVNMNLTMKMVTASPGLPEESIF
jgi:hypothetical protein